YRQLNDRGTRYYKINVGRAWRLLSRNRGETWELLSHERYNSARRK
ncbi:ParE family toxin-like protein, partial [Escherichia coli]